MTNGNGDLTCVPLPSILLLCANNVPDAPLSSESGRTYINAISKYN
jgi:hypothetical protein